MRRNRYIYNIGDRLRLRPTWLGDPAAGRMATITSKSGGGYYYHMDGTPSSWRDWHPAAYFERALVNGVEDHNK